MTCHFNAWSVSDSLSIPRDAPLLLRDVCEQFRFACEWAVGTGFKLGFFSGTKMPTRSCVMPFNSYLEKYAREYVGDYDSSDQHKGVVQKAGFPVHL